MNWFLEVSIQLSAEEGVLRMSRITSRSHTIRTPIVFAYCVLPKCIRLCL